MDRAAEPDAGSSANLRQTGQNPTTRRFAVPGWSGEVAAHFGVPSLADEVARLTDPSATVETIHWGRNYLYAAELATDDGPLAVVVKQLHNQSVRRRLERRLRGSRAAASWRIARALVAAGIPTPEPVLLIESDRASGPSFYVCRHLQGAFEVRHFFRRLNREAEPGAFPDVKAEEFLAKLGGFCRELHDAGVWYRDLSIGNVLARPRPDGGVDLWLVDCNRARLERRLGLIRRILDICRLPVLATPHRQAFLRGYWGKVPRPSDARWWLWTASVRGYLLKHALKRRFRSLRLHRRHAHRLEYPPHLPPPDDAPSWRDKVVWDHLSDQPYQHASRLEKLAIRTVTVGDHLRELITAGAAAPAAWRRYRALTAELYRRPTRFGGIGVGLRPWPQGVDTQVAAVAELGVRSVLLRLHPWEKDHAADERLAAALVERGCEVAFALPQNRELVRDRARWRAAIEEIAERFTAWGRTFEVGHAPNRSKWGVWTLAEFADLYAEAADILRRRPGVEVIGPAVIDFEFQVLTALVNRRHPGLEFDVVSSLLYVDRRGAPENRQLGLDAAGKAVLLRAISELGRNSNGRCWITEVNWPLREGPHAPAGLAAAVDAGTQADYLVRYYLLVLGTGLVERVYWWQLLARGYGLMTANGEGSLTRRPAFSALRTLIAELEGGSFLGPLPAPSGSFLYRFDRGGERIVVGWSVAPGVTAELPGRPARVVGRDGDEQRAPDGSRVELATSPRYFVLAD